MTNYMLLQSLEFWGDRIYYTMASLMAHTVKNLLAMWETRVQSLGQEDRSPGEGNVNPLQYSCLENPMNRGGWQATVHGVAKRWTPLSN